MKLRHFSYPVRCASLAQFCERFPHWEQAGRELAQCGIPSHPLMQAQALDNLVPDALLQIIVGRPDLAAFEPKLQWVKSQVEHHRGAVQAQQVSGSAKAFQSLPVDAEQAWPETEWTDPSGPALPPWIQQVVFALTKGKGKGAKGSSKGGGKGINREGTAFASECFHCGEVGHRKFECPKAADGQPDKGKAKGKGGKGKDGKGKTGKTLDAANIDADAAEGTSVPSEEETWWFGAQ